MILYHVTSAGSVSSILRTGLRAAGSHEGRPIVWLCDEARLLWTLSHVARWRGRDPSSMRILGVECERGEVVRVRPGTYVSWRDIPPERIACSTLHARIVLEPVIRFIVGHVQRGATIEQATERARRDARFAGLSAEVLEQAARLAQRLSQPDLERAARESVLVPTATPTR